jgi:hypothetical protein
MHENLLVISRINERIHLLRAEVEKRGMPWSEAQVDDHRHISQQLVNGHSTTQPQSGSLSDDQLRAQLESRLAQDDQQDQQQEEEGLHL